MEGVWWRAWASCWEAFGYGPWIWGRGVTCSYFVLRFCVILGFVAFCALFIIRCWILVLSSGGYSCALCTLPSELLATLDAAVAERNPRRRRRAPTNVVYMAPMFFL